MRCSRLLPREIEESDGPVGAGDAEDAATVVDVAARGFELVRRRVLRFPTVRSAGHVHRRAADEERARAGAAEARAAIGVALDDADLLDGHAENVDGQLRVRRREPLPERLRRRKDFDLVAAFDRDRHTLVEHVGAGPFDERRKAAAAQPAATLRIGGPRARNPASRRVPAPAPSRIRTCRCRRSCSSRSCTASARGGSCCAGAVRRDRCRSAARPHPSIVR